MQTLHINAEDSVIQELMQLVNSYSKEGKEVYIIDDKLLQTEKKMIDQAMSEIQSGETQGHKELWSELLDEN